MLRGLLNTLLSFASALFGRRRGSTGDDAPARAQMLDRDHGRSVASAWVSAQDALPALPAAQDDPPAISQLGADAPPNAADHGWLLEGEPDDVAPGPAPADESAGLSKDVSRRRSAGRLAGDVDGGAARDTAPALPLAQVPAAAANGSDATSADRGTGDARSAALATSMLAIEEAGDHVPAAGPEPPEPPSEPEPPAPQRELEPAGCIGVAKTAATRAAAAFSGSDGEAGCDPAPDEPQKVQSAGDGAESETGMSLPPPEVLKAPSESGYRDASPDAGVDMCPEQAEAAPADARAEALTAETAPRGPPTRPPARYRPQLGQNARTPSRAQFSALSAIQQAMQADFLLSFQPGDWGFDVAALLRRPPCSPDQLEISDGGEAVGLASIDEAILEPLPVSDLAASLAEGFAAETVSGPRLRWIRTGRRLHVFSERSGVPGFATVPRVIIGQENAALCTREFAPSALEQIIATGSPAPSEIEGPGLPAGWVCWKGIRPAHPHAPAGADELLNALDPRPDAAIELVGGITAARGQWIEGYAPSICIAGTAPAPGEVTIDGAPAAAGADGGWTAPGWDAEGVHQVEYRGIRRSYAIVRAATSWPWWAAHSSGIELAGALGSASGIRPPLILAGPSLWLVGARPGQISRTIQRPDAPGAYATPGFEPVWAVARKTGRCRPRPALLGMAVPPQPAAPGTAATSIRAWCQIIRGAGPPTVSADEVEAALWRKFIQAARSARRHRR